MKNTLENKAKFFAQYWGQDVLFHLSQTWNLFGDFENVIDDNPNCYLLLKPLSSITDEDAIEVAMLLVNWQSSMSKLSKINIRGRIDGDHVWDELILEFTGSFNYTVRYRGGDWLGWINSNGRCEWTLFNHLKVYDYLRSKGYLLPWMGVSTDQILEYGWARIKTI